MSAISDIRTRGGKTLVVTLVLGALWFVYGAVSAFANAGNPTLNVHQNNANEENPIQNRDNTLNNHACDPSADCSTAVSTNPSPTPNTPSATPGIAIVKYERIGQSGAFVRGPLTATVGQTVEYKIVVTNEVNTALTVTLSDPRCDSGTITPSDTPTIAAGGTETYFCTHVLVKTDAGSFVNTATATGQTVSGTKVGPVSSHVLVKVSASGVLGAEKVVEHKTHKVHRTLKRHKTVNHVAHVKAVTKVAHAAHPVIKSAAFTG